MSFSSQAQVIQVNLAAAAVLNKRNRSYWLHVGGSDGKTPANKRQWRIKWCHASRIWRKAATPLCLYLEHRAPTIWHWLQYITKSREKAPQLHIQSRKFLVIPLSPVRFDSAAVGDITRRSSTSFYNLPSNCYPTLSPAVSGDEHSI